MRTLCSTLLLIAASTLLAGDWKSKGETTLESRQFEDDHEAQTQDSGLGMFARLEVDVKQGPWRANLRGFGRLDRKDSERDLTAIEEFWAGYRDENWEARLGYQMLNWTATEAFHPADMVNSRNLDSNIENPEKLGELMLSLRRRIGEGGLTGYYMPYLEAPRLPGGESRLSFLPAGAVYRNAVWVTDRDALADDDWADQYGLRFNQTIGDVDFSVHYLDHLDRSQPQVALDFEGGIQVTPVYFRVKDLGLTYLQVIGPVIFKLEAGHRDFVDADAALLAQIGATGVAAPLDHKQIAFGLEYGLSHENGSETTWLLEGMTLTGVDKDERAALSPWQRDMLFGVRHAFNDTMSRELLITTIVDVERSHELLVNVSYKQRLSDTWSVQTGARYVDAPQKGSASLGLEFLDQSNQVFLNVSRFF